jgi:hypothetical protein
VALLLLVASTSHSLRPGTQVVQNVSRDTLLGLPQAAQAFDLLLRLRAVPLDDSMLDDMASARLWGVSPLVGHRIRHIHHEFHR